MAAFNARDEISLLVDMTFIDFCHLPILIFMAFRSYMERQGVA